VHGLNDPGGSSCCVRGPNDPVGSHYEQSQSLGTDLIDSRVNFKAEQCHLFEFNGEHLALNKSLDIFHENDVKQVPPTRSGQ